MAGLRVPLSTLRLRRHRRLRRTRGHGGSLRLPCRTLSFLALCRFIPAPLRTLKFQQTYNRGEASFTAPGIFASGADPTDGNFFVVVTIQRGQAPQVNTTGKGLDATVTVGGRTIRFDGSKILLQ